VVGQVSQGVHLAEITVKTTNKNLRTQDLQEMKTIFRDVFKNETDCIATIGIPTVVGGASSEIELEILGPDLAVLDEVGRNITAESKKSGILVDVDNNIRAEKPQVKIIPKRSVINDMGINSTLVGTILRGYIEGVKAGTYKSGDRSYDIRVKLEEENGKEQLKEFSVISKKGKPLGIETVTNFVEDSTPIQISRESKTRIAKVFANPAPGKALGDALSWLEKQIKPNLKPGYTMKFLGRAEKMEEAQADFLEAIIIAAVLTYLLIAALLESWLQPLIILLTLPLALIGLFIALFLVGRPLSMMGLLGAVMLIGIVVNNAILIMDNVVVLIKQGESPKEAMLKSAKDKFRPILMMSIAAVLGVAPMAFSSGLGSEIRSSCGIAVIGGLVSSTVLSLYVIPLFYIQFFSKKKDKKKIKQTKVSSGN
jgi:HAE1 family hydrophobic/amphiphilic exporter-1